MKADGWGGPQRLAVCAYGGGYLDLLSWKWGLSITRYHCVTVVRTHLNMC